MNTINQNQFAKICGVKRQDITQLIDKNTINIVIEKNKKLIDLDGRLTRAYMVSKGIQLDPIENMPSARTLDFDMDVSSAVELYKISLAKHKRASHEQVELKNAYLRGELIERELVYTQIMYLIDKVFANVRRNGRAFLGDNSNRIALAINNGTPLTDVLNEWDQINMNAMADAKEDVIAKIETIQKEQAASG